jgi:hypothetical protein
VQDGSLVQQDAATMDGSRIWNFIRMKELESRLIDDVLWRVSKNFKDGIRRVKDISVRM